MKLKHITFLLESEKGNNTYRVEYVPNPDFKRIFSCTGNYFVTVYLNDSVLSSFKDSEANSSVKHPSMSHSKKMIAHARKITRSHGPTG